MLTWLEPYWLVVVPILWTVVGLGFLLFIHEFGHFFVAKRSGVKVEVFSLGIAHFLFSWTWDGTVYALSWLPLGGYVRMAGQQDLAPPPGHKPKPWEYGAKRPIIRMAIIAAGVTMNFIGGYMCYTASFMVGRDVYPPKVGELDGNLLAHEQALKAGLLAGDKIFSVNGDPVYTLVGLNMRVARITPDTDVTLTVRGADEDGQEAEIRTIVLRTKEGDARGLSSIAPYLSEPMVPRTVRAGFAVDDRLMITPLAERLSQFPEWSQLFRPADLFETVNDQTCRSDKEFRRILDECGGQPITVEVLGSGGARRTVKLPVRSQYIIGVSFLSTRNKILRVARVIEGSPAEKAGIRAGDRLYLGAGGEARACRHEEFVRQVQQNARTGLAVTAESPDGTRKTVHLKPWESGWYPDPGGQSRGAQFVPYGDSQIVREVVPGSMAEAKGLAPGAVLLEVGTETDLRAPIQISWVYEGRKHGRHRLEVYADGPSVTRMMVPRERLRLGLGEALTAGWSETIETLMGTTVVLRKIIFREARARDAFSGPVTIVNVAYRSAEEGLGKMLWLLGLVGVSLAFFNILPIPVLDGGHMVFLLYEAVIRRPPSPRVVEIAQYAGLLLILSLFAFVFWNDISRMVSG